MVKVSCLGFCCMGSLSWPSLACVHIHKLVSAGKLQMSAPTTSCQRDAHLLSVMCEVSWLFCFVWCQTTKCLLFLHMSLCRQIESDGDLLTGLQCRTDLSKVHLRRYYYYYCCCCYLWYELPKCLLHTERCRQRAVLQTWRGLQTQRVPSKLYLN